MSGKKHKKRHSASAEAVKRQAVQDQIADQKDKERKRMDPAARLLLLGDLVFLAFLSILDRNGLLSPTLNAAGTGLGIVLLAAALYFQFGKKGRGGGPSGPRLK